MNVVCGVQILVVKMLVYLYFIHINSSGTIKQQKLKLVGGDGVYLIMPDNNCLQLTELSTTMIRVVGLATNLVPRVRRPSRDCG